MEVNDEVKLRRQSKWTTNLGTVAGILFFVLFWKQGFGLNVFLFTTFVIGCIQAIKLLIKDKWYFSKWDLLLVLYWVMSIGVVLNDSLSMNFIISFFVLGSLPYIVYLALYPETFNRFSYINSFLLYIQQLFSPFAGLGVYFRSLFKIKGSKFISPNSLKIVIGLIISVPLLCILTFLLMSADDAFRRLINDFINWINYFIKEVLHLDNIFDIFMLFVFIIGGIFVSIGYIFAKVKFPLKDNEYEEQTTGIDMVISNVVLASVNLLFLVFIIVQIKYLFLASGDIKDLGLTYSEYARKGYWELQAVTVIVGSILYLLIRWGRKHFGVVDSIAKGNLVFLLLNSMVILFSALFRMGLYFDAYGFTLMRVYPFVFMLFEFLLFLYLIPSTVSRKVFKYFSFYSFGLCMVIMTILSLLSPERIVAELNISRAKNLNDGKSLDIDYLMTLSSDGWSPLVKDEYLNNHKFLACQIVAKYDWLKGGYSWHEWNYSRSQTFSNIRKNILKGQDISTFESNCNHELSNAANDLVEEYKTLLMKEDYESIYRNLWKKTSDNGLDMLKGSLANVTNVEIEPNKYDSQMVFSYPQSYQQYINYNLKYKISYPSDMNFVSSECVNDYIGLSVINGDLKISSSSVLPLGFETYGSYYSDGSYNKTTLQQFADGTLYRTVCY